MARKTMMTDLKTPGSIYARNGRYYWNVRLPGETKAKARPLVPEGATLATTDPGEARRLAREQYQKALRQVDTTLTIEVASPALKPDGTISDLAARYMKHANDYYRGHDGKTTKEVVNIQYALLPVLSLFGSMHPEIFGPLALKEVRKWLVAQELSRGVINQRIGIVKRLFRWAASEQLVPGNVWHALEAVTGLRANERVGDKVVQDRPKVRPVAEGIVRETMKAMTPTVAAMTELQLLTGMRSEELTSMRVCDIDRSRDTWVYKPLHHKTEHHGSDHVRVVFLGPKAQALLMPYFDRALERRGLAGHLFTPADATKERFVTMRAARQSSVQPSHVCRAKEAPILRPGDCYNTNSYGRAVHYALVKRNAQLAAEALKPYHVDKLDKIKDKKVLKAATAAVEASQLPNWHPHQLRHTAGTLIRKVGGRDAARAFLGHKESRITDDYAEIDETLAVDMARKIG